MASSLRWSSVLAWRVRRQQLGERAPRKKALSVVGRIAGLHAQLTASAELTLWARVARLRRDEVSRALWEERSLVKTWAMRGTLHLLPAGELGLWVAAQGGLKPRYEMGSWLRHHGLEREQAEATLAAIPAALDGRQLTREELVMLASDGRLSRAQRAGAEAEAAALAEFLSGELELTFARQR